MPIEKITQRIYSDARKEVAKLKKYAEDEAGKIRKIARKEAEEKAADVLKRAKSNAQEEKARILALARLASRDLVLRAKRDALDSAFQHGLEKIAALPEQKYLGLIEKMLLEAVETGEEEIVLSTKDEKRIDQTFIEQVNRELARQGRIGRLSLSSEKRDLRGGFVLKKGGIETNLSLPVLLESVRVELESKVIEALLE